MRSTIGIRISWIIFEFITRSGSLSTYSTAGLTLDLFDLMSLSVPLVHYWIFLIWQRYYNWSIFCSISRRLLRWILSCFLVLWILSAASLRILLIALQKFWILSKFRISTNVNIFLYRRSSYNYQKYFKMKSMFSELCNSVNYRILFTVSTLTLYVKFLLNFR